MLTDRQALCRKGWGLGADEGRMQLETLSPAEVKRRRCVKGREGLEHELKHDKIQMDAWMEWVGWVGQTR